MTEKEKKSKEEEQKERDDYNFNEGRLSADRKWISAIDNRIRELEISVGIPELKRIKTRTIYRWKEQEERK
jgi:hypothetical protein